MWFCSAGQQEMCLSASVCLWLMTKCVYVRGVNSEKWSFPFTVLVIFFTLYKTKITKIYNIKLLRQCKMSRLIEDIRTMFYLKRTSWGVPQGSILVPMLFSLYMLQLGSTFRKHGILFADDMQIYLPVRKVNETTLDSPLTCLNEVNTWLSSNFFNFNESKTELVWFGGPTLHFSHLSLTSCCSLHFCRRTQAILICQ